MQDRNIYATCQLTKGRPIVKLVSPQLKNKAALASLQRNYFS